jgi:hypothetical protein
MKTTLVRLFIVIALFVGTDRAAAQGTAFTYHGQVEHNGIAASGLYDFQFSLFNAPSGGSQVGNTLSIPDIRVTDGLFNATLDFGPVFTGNPAWLAIAVRTNGASSYNALSPLQQLTPSPFAITAENLAGVVLNNFITGAGDTISGGDNNRTSNFDSTISGGANNIASAAASGVSGGSENNASGPFVTIAGGQGNVIQGGASNSIILGGNSDQILVNASDSFIGGGQGNSIASNASWSAVVGGLNNGIQANSQYIFIGGGQNHSVTSSYNEGSRFTTIVGGQNNSFTDGDYATIGGGYGNSSEGGVIAGGYGNSGEISPGGFSNSGYEDSFVAGNQAQGDFDTDFVWADSQDAPFAATGDNQFLIRAQGNVGINTATPQQNLSLTGVMNINQNLHLGDLGGNSLSTDVAALTFGYGSGEGVASQLGISASYDHDLVLYTGFVDRFMILQNGDVAIGNNTVYYSPFRLFMVGGTTNSAYCDGTTWVNSSDRNSKQDFAALGPLEALQKVSALSITEWKYKQDASGVKHIGPMAQDFHAAFGLNGADDKHIATVDEEGVALAAIQGLRQKLDNTQQTMRARDREIQSLQQRDRSIAVEINDLEAVLQSLAVKK